MDVGVSWRHIQGFACARATLSHIHIHHVIRTRVAVCQLEHRNRIRHLLAALFDGLTSFAQAVLADAAYVWQHGRVAVWLVARDVLPRTARPLGQRAEVANRLWALARRDILDPPGAARYAARPSDGTALSSQGCNSSVPADVIGQGRYVLSVFST